MKSNKNNIYQVLYTRIAVLVLFVFYCNINVMAQELEVEPSGYKWYKVEKKGLFGVKNLDGKTIVPVKYMYILYWDHTGHFVVMNKNGYAECYDNKGKKIIGAKEKYDKIFPNEKDGIIWFQVYRDNFVGVYTSTWGEVIPPNRFSFVYYHTDSNTNIGSYGRKGYFSVKDSSGFGIYDAYGNKVIGTDRGYSWVTPHGRGLYNKDTWFKVRKDSLYGVCLIYDFEIIPIKYKRVYHSDIFGFQARTTDDELIDLDIRMSSNGFQRMPSKQSDKLSESSTTIVTDNTSSNNHAATSDKCPMCVNTNGKCYICSGTGRAWWVPFYVQCTACYGTGKCPMCHGTGIWIPGTENVPMNTGGTNSNYQNDNNKRKKQETVTSHDCSACHGTGYESTRRTAPSYGGTKIKEYCSICKGNYYPHYHNPCSVCHGKGQIK